MFLLVFSVIERQLEDEVFEIKCGDPNVNTSPIIMMMMVAMMMMIMMIMAMIMMIIMAMMMMIMIEVMMF